MELVQGQARPNRPINSLAFVRMYGIISSSKSPPPLYLSLSILLLRLSPIFHCPQSSCRATKLSPAPSLDEIRVPSRRVPRPVTRPSRLSLDHEASRHPMAAVPRRSQPVLGPAAIPAAAADEPRRAVGRIRGHRHALHAGSSRPLRRQGRCHWRAPRPPALAQRQGRLRPRALQSRPLPPEPRHAPTAQHRPWLPAQHALELYRLARPH